MDNEQLLQAISNLLDEKLEEKLDKKLDEKLDKKLDEKLDKKLEPINNRLDKMDSRLEKLESDVSALRMGQVDIRKELKKVKHKVSDTYDLALDAWGTSTENRNWIEGDKLKA